MALAGKGNFANELKCEMCSSCSQQDFCVCWAISIENEIVAEEQLWPSCIHDGLYYIAAVAISALIQIPWLEDA